MLAAREQEIHRAATRPEVGASTVSGPVPSRPTSRHATALYRHDWGDSSVAAALVTIKPGGMRELHGHPNADEWQYFLKGSARMTVSAHLNIPGETLAKFPRGAQGIVPCHSRALGRRWLRGLRHLAGCR
jgi:mannose-6-phosphate isomerase-like protein (cupin superfamily)